MLLVLVVRGAASERDVEKYTSCVSEARPSWALDVSGAVSTSIASRMDRFNVASLWSGEPS
jgi:hypothetical protein